MGRVVSTAAGTRRSIELGRLEHGLELTYHSHYEPAVVDSKADWDPPRSTVMEPDRPPDRLAMSSLSPESCLALWNIPLQ